MLLVRGDTRVADIYLTEFDRIFRHFYFRNVANEIEAKGGRATGAFLAENSKWTNSYFNPKSFKTRRRELFFADSSLCWVKAAGERPAEQTERRKATGGAKKKSPMSRKRAARPARTTANEAVTNRPSRKQRAR